jgi:hypothetical protein
MTAYPDRYVVWRRSDGYVSATVYVPRPHGDITFEVLLDTTDWPTACARIEAERAAVTSAAGDEMAGAVR